MIKFILFIIIFVIIVSCQPPQPTPTAFAQGVAQTTESAARVNKVEIRKINNKYQLYRNGKPYFIKGASGHTHLDIVKAAGGNSIRTYTTDGLDTLLDRALALDLSVAVGIYVGREMEWFDYNDKMAVQKQAERILADVKRYKDHPAVLCWIIGNEPDIISKNPKPMWLAINDLIEKVRLIDPHHPITVAVNTSSAKHLLEKCPVVDFVAVNTFGHVADFAQNFKYDKPYIYSEWGSLGPWESKKTYWQAPLEETVKGKYARIRSAYPHILQDSARCLGSYVFYWGQKQEVTPSWFSLFLENGNKTILVDIMYELWGNRIPPNRAPLLDSILVNNIGVTLHKELQADTQHTAFANGSDADNDTLSYHWEIIPEGPLMEFRLGSGYVEVRPKAIPNLIIENKGNQVLFKTPTETGPYRLLIEAYDGRGGGASANIPFFVVNNRFTQ